MSKSDAEREPLDDERLEGWLRDFGPAAPPPDADFASQLRGRFLAAVEAEGREAKPADAATGELPDAGRGLRWLLWPVAALGVALALLVAAPLLRPDAPSAPVADVDAPAPMARDALVAANAEAWDGVTDVFGVYRDAEGRGYQEWVAFRADGPPRYRRLLLGEGELPGVQDQWNISDGDTAWIVDGASGEVLESARDDEDLSVPTVLQCGALALPSAARDGPSPSPGVLDGRAVYRMEAVSEGETIVYWVDAADFLVYRVDDAQGRTVWKRDALSTNTGMSDGLFDPANLNRHEG